MPVQAETENDQDADDAEDHADEYSELTGGALRADGSRKSPLAEKFQIPTPKMEGGRKYADDEKRQIQRIRRSVATVSYVERPWVSQRSV